MFFIKIYDCSQFLMCKIENTEPFSYLQACMQSIERQVGKDAPPEIQSTEILIKHILMVGELAQAAPKSINQSHIKLLQNLLLSPRKREGR